MHRDDAVDMAASVERRRRNLSLATQVKIISGALTETLMAGLAVVCWRACLLAEFTTDVLEDTWTTGSKCQKSQKLSSADVLLRANKNLGPFHNPRAIRSGAPIEAGMRSCTGFRIGHLFWNLFTSTFLTAGLQTVFRVRNCRISDLSVGALLSMLRPGLVRSMH